MTTDTLFDRLADVWTALPKVVFSRTLSGVENTPATPS